MQGEIEERAIDKAVRLVGGTVRGSKAKAAREFGISPAYLNKILRTGRVPSERCKDIEAATDGEVTAEDLRPDIFKPRQAA